MKRFHAKCTGLCAEGLSDGRGGIGGKAKADRLGNVFRDIGSKDDIPCTIDDIGTIIDSDRCLYECVIEVEDQYEAELLAAGLKPVEAPESDEAFVKRHYPTAYIRHLQIRSCDVWFESGRNGYTGPLGTNCTPGNHRTESEAWAEAADMVRRHLALVGTPTPQPAPQPQPQADANEVFVKAHYPKAWLVSLGSRWYVQYGSEPGDGPLRYYASYGIYDTHAAAWAKAAEEVRQMLAKKQPQPQTQQPQPLILNPTIPMNQNPTPSHTSFMQRMRGYAKALSSEACTGYCALAAAFAILTSASVAAHVDAAAKSNTFGVVFLSIIAPFLVAATSFSLLTVYAIFTQDYVPPVKEAKKSAAATPSDGMGGSVAIGYSAHTVATIATAQPRRSNGFGRIFGRFVWWAVGSALYVAAGYSACWVQANWTAICFDLGGFLQRVAQ